MADVTVISQAQMTTNVRALLNEPVALGLTDADIYQFIDDGVIDMATKGLLARCNTITLALSGSDTYASSVGEYEIVTTVPISASMFKIYTCLYLGAMATDDGADVGYATARGLIKIHPRMIKHLPSTLGPPIYWYYTTSWQSAASKNVIGVWPKPALAQNTYLVKVFFYEYLNAYYDATNVLVPDWAQDVLMWYTYAKCLEREGKFSQAEQYMSYYNNMVMFMRNDIIDPGVESKDMMVQPDYTRVAQ